MRDSEHRVACDGKWLRWATNAPFPELVALCATNSGIEPSWGLRKHALSMRSATLRFGWKVHLWRDTRLAECLVPITARPARRVPRGRERSRTARTRAGRTR